MNFFVSLAKANAENARLAAELGKLTDEQAAVAAGIAERDAAAESCRVQFDATLTDLTAKLTAATGEIASLKASAETAAKQAADIVAAQGLNPSSLPKGNSAPAAATMKRAEFNNLHPADRAAFCRTGGKLSE